MTEDASSVRFLFDEELIELHEVDPTATLLDLLDARAQQ